MKPLKLYKPTLACLALCEDRNNMFSSYTAQFFSYLVTALFESKLSCLP